MKLRIRRIIFWLHLAVGITAGIVILSTAVTGIILSTEVPVTEWGNRHLRVAAGTGTPALLDPALAVSRLAETEPGAAPGAITWKSDPVQPVSLTLGRDDVRFLHPVTGDSLGTGNRWWPDFFHATTEWHRFLTGTGLPRETGRLITGTACLLFGFLLLSGIFLWWPRVRSAAAFRSILVFKRGARGRARNWNWHNVLGFWSAGPLLLIILTGLVISFSWANALLFRAAGSEPPPPKEKGRPQAPREALPPPDLTALAPLITQAAGTLPGWETITLRMPQKAGTPFPLVIENGGRGQPQRKSSFLLDPVTAAVQTAPDDYSRQEPARKLRLFARFAHTGEWFGPAGQVIAAVAAAAAAVLVWTGFALSWRRFRNRRKRPVAL